MPRGFRKSSRRTSPGCTGRIQWYRASIWCGYGGGGQGAVRRSARISSSAVHPNLSMIYAGRGDRFDTVFTLLGPICSSKFTVGGFTVGVMNAQVVRARYMSLALLVAAVIDHGKSDNSRAAPVSSGLMRLGRELMRRAAGVQRKPV